MSRSRRSGWLVVFACAALTGAAVQSARAGQSDDGADLFATGATALREGRAGDAIAALEALADRGVVDAVASYDRGLAYAERIRAGAEVPGDLGRAAQGLEEARELSSDAKLADDASAALVIVRSEIARRRVRAGQPVEVDPGRSLARAIAHMLGEDTWGWLAVLASLALTAGLFVRWLSPSARARVVGATTAGVSVPLLLVAVAMTLAARHDRDSLREAVVVSDAARPTDDHGIALSGATPLPEGARVEIIDVRGATSRVRFGATDAWIASSAIRAIARQP